MRRNSLRLQDLYTETLKKVFQDEKSWESFWSAVCWNYKCSFNELILLYAQRPQARAILEMERWNRQFGRWVKRGSKAIALWNEETGGIRYFFDIADTYERRAAKPVPLWRIQSADNVIENLRERYILPEECRSLEDAFVFITEQSIFTVTAEEREHIQMYTTLEEEEAESLYRELLRETLLIVLLSRCELTREGYLRERITRQCNIFQHKECAILLGERVLAEARPILQEIGQQQNMHDYTFSVKKDALYTESVLNTEQEAKGHENHISGMQRTLISGGGKREGDGGQIRLRETDLFENAKNEVISRFVDQWSAGEGTGTNRKNRDAERRGIDPKDGTTRGLDGNIQKTAASSLDTTNEQYPTESGRDRESRTDLSVERKTGETENVPPILLPEKRRYRIPEGIEKPLGPKGRFQQNMAAIETMRRCLQEEREATDEEKDVLCQYQGWGSMADAFDTEKWPRENEQLRNLLSETEYEEARASVLTAFYTPSEAIRQMYGVLERMGFSKGNILEPSCGVGRFIGHLSDRLQESHFYGQEIDTISGQIARLLYPTDSIRIQSFEKSEYPEGFFDVAIGNVPFGAFRVNDPAYQRFGFYIHDYFIAKSLDLVRPGGIVAYITTKGTLDKRGEETRRYLAERSTLLGAVRLPDTFFTGTRVTTDILFLQRKEESFPEELQWIQTREQEGEWINCYFLEHPEMIVGELRLVQTAFGREWICRARENEDSYRLLEKALEKIEGKITEPKMEEFPVEVGLPADPERENHSYLERDGKIFYQNGSRMYPVRVNREEKERIYGMMGLRDQMRRLFQRQLDGCEDSELQREQRNLEEQYDRFRERYGMLHDRKNKKVFIEDSAYYMLCSLEVLDEKGNFQQKADLFYQRTIRPRHEITHTDTAMEALSVSLQELGRVDLSYMARLCGTTEDVVQTGLTDVIFYDPKKEEWESGEEYLSGNVRQKLADAREYAAIDPRFQKNVEALQKVQPEPIQATQIRVRLGATWIPVNIVNRFMHEIFRTPFYYRHQIHAEYSSATAEWKIEGKGGHRDSVELSQMYGTKRMNAYKVLEETLNLKSIKVYDYVEQDGKKKAVYNHKESMLLQEKQRMLEKAWEKWIWKEPERRKQITDIYNERFNHTRLRTYDGSYLSFPGMNPEIQLRRYQKDAVARILHGGNTLLAHTVGAGKTYTMIAASQELKRIGLAHKSLFVVPNHLVEQWRGDYLRLYPAAKVFAVSKEDFQKENRRRFMARIATGNYDAIIIGHSQLEKIPLSRKRQRWEIQRQIDEILEGLRGIKGSMRQSFTVKQLEKVKKGLEVRLAQLDHQEKRDEGITFEELGIDHLFVDESHLFKNLYLYTKMQNVAGIAQSQAQKSSHLYAICNYLNELTHEKGIVFASGTPISNSMTELYTVQRYLQPSVLKAAGVQHFDAWAATFGETVSGVELSPEGNGYRMKTRFSRFFNLPELMTMFRQSADIQTAEMLQLPVPHMEMHIEKIKASPIQEEMIQELSERAEEVRGGRVDPHADNLLKITNDGRKLALDQRLMNPVLAEAETDKVKCCVANVYDIWKKTENEKLTQLIFCDMSTPKTDQFNVYDAIREKLMEQGIPKEQIAYIHTADNDKKKKTLFEQMREGSIRILLGSTAKMGAGTNVQNRLYAIHDLDCPWRPADLEQRMGRLVRQGNQNQEVHVFRYITEGTFDAYLYQLVENKQRFISQIMSGKVPVRSAEDLDEAVLSYAEIKAQAAGSPEIKEKMELEVEYGKLTLLKQQFLEQKFMMEDQLAHQFPQRKRVLKERIQAIEEDINQLKKYPEAMLISEENSLRDKGRIGEKLREVYAHISDLQEHAVGEYRGFRLTFQFQSLDSGVLAILQGRGQYRVEMGESTSGNVLRIDHRLERLPEEKEEMQQNLRELERQERVATEEVKKTFDREGEMETIEARLQVLNAKLNLDLPNEKTHICSRERSQL